MANLHYTKLLPAAFSATTAAAGYAVSNVGLESLGRPWRATGVGANDVILTLAAATTVKTLHLHDVNFATCNVYKSSDGVVYNLVGALAPVKGKEGRLRGAIVINDPNVLAVKISIAAGAATDGLGFWRIGAAYLFASSVAIGSPFQFDYVAKWIRPQVKVELANRRPAVATTGIGFHVVSLPYKPTDAEDLETLFRLAGAGTALLELALANYPAQLWPVRYLDDDFNESFREPKLSEGTVTFTEVV